MAEGFTQQPQFSAVQQLQDSSTLESQALTSSYHSQNLLHVSGAEVVSHRRHRDRDPGRPITLLLYTTRSAARLPCGQSGRLCFCCESKLSSDVFKESLSNRDSSAFKCKTVVCVALCLAGYLHRCVTHPLSATQQFTGVRIVIWKDLLFGFIHTVSSFQIFSG